MTAPLFVFDRLAGPLRRLGVDYPRFRSILAVKLALDGRRQHGWVQGTKRLTPLAWSLLVHLGMGCWLAAIPWVVPSALTAITLIHTVVMVMLAFDLVADYSALLLDPTEATVLAARPVAPRTVLAARLAHVATYLTMYVGALAVGTALAGGLRWGAAFVPLYLASLVGAVVLVLAAVTLVYLAIMRVVSDEGLRDATMWAQLAMTVLTIGVYYVASAIDFRTASGFEDRAWILFYPPAWMAGLPALAVPDARGPVAPLAALGLAAPWPLAALALRLGSGFRVGGGVPVRRGATRTSRVAANVAARTMPTPTTRALFELVWAIAARDRQFKTRTYPGLLAVVLFVVAFAALAVSGVWEDRFGDVARTNMHLFLLYYGILIIPTPILMSPYTDRPEAAWIHRSMPIAAPGTILVAGLAVLFARYVFPVFAAIAVVVLALWGRAVVADVALAFATTLLVTVAFPLMTGRRLPFTAPPPGGASGTTAGAIMGGMLLVVVLAVAHWTLLQVGAAVQPWPVLAAIPVVLAIAYGAGRTLAATRWSDLPAARHA